MRSAAFVALLVAVTFVFSAQAFADCASGYTCAITAQGLPYCKTLTNGSQTCLSSTNPYVCTTGGERCGGGGRVENPEARNECAGKRWILASVEVPATPEHPKFILVAQMVGVHDKGGPQ